MMLPLAAHVAATSSDDKLKAPYPACQWNSSMPDRSLPSRKENTFMTPTSRAGMQVTSP